MTLRKDGRKFKLRKIEEGDEAKEEREREVKVDEETEAYISVFFRFLHSLLSVFQSF